VRLGRCTRELDRLGRILVLIELSGSHTLEDPKIVRGSAGERTKLLYFHGHFVVVPVQDRAHFTMR
jgi:succinyl-diaminopimelate desuccinylase